MWLIKCDVLSAMRDARHAGVKPGADYLAGAVSALSNKDHLPRNLSIAGNTAEIAVNGVLTPRRDFFAEFFGGGNTVYGDIINALAVAETDPNVTNIVLSVDSPGGSVSGLFDTLAALQSVTKPIVSKVSNLAASAAFAIVSQTDEIIAANAAASFGSIGVAIDAFVDEDIVSITSTEAPNKRPDITTEAGRAVVREELDALHDLFVDSIGAGRTAATGQSFTAGDVNKNFGRGSVLVAAAAKDRGMIDRIATDKTELSLVGSNATHQQSPAAVGGNLTPEKPMDLQTLQAQHPDVYAAAVGVGITQGTTQERARVTDHLKVGKSAGAMDIALEAIKAGDDLTARQADYMSAAINQRDLNNHSQDGDELSEITGTGDISDQQAADQQGKDVLAKLNKEMGIGSALTGWGI